MKGEEEGGETQCRNLAGLLDGVNSLAGSRGEHLNGSVRDTVPTYLGMLLIPLTFPPLRLFFFRPSRLGKKKKKKKKGYLVVSIRPALRCGSGDDICQLNERQAGVQYSTIETIACQNISFWIVLWFAKLKFKRE